MIFRKILRYTLSAILLLVGLILLFVVIALGPVNRTPVEDYAFYDSMRVKLQTLNVEAGKPQSTIRTGFSRVNITPSQPVATAGYGSRRGQAYRSVQDSVYIRTLVVDNGSEQVAIVSGDLLLIPPTVLQVLPEKLEPIGFSLDNTYLGATHTHNSIGNWGEGAMTILYGDYSDTTVQFIADAIVASISQASRDLQSSVLKTGAIAAPEPVRNRLMNDGFEDAFLRVLEIERVDGVRAVLMTYSAHATCSSQKSIVLSRDYPGELVDALENHGYDFAMFMAGAVGSHTTSAPARDQACMAWMGEQLAETFIAGRSNLRPMSDSTVAMVRVRLPLSDPQVKISENWKVRSWLFRTAFGEYPAFLTALRIGDLVMLGAPCDFSGYFHPAIDSAARNYNLQAMITSFNGGYIGYVTPSRYYDHDHYETRLMNWYAPGTGEYIQQNMEQLIRVLSDAR